MWGRWFYWGDVWKLSGLGKTFSGKEQGGRKPIFSFFATRDPDPDLPNILEITSKIVLEFYIFCLK